MFSLYFDGRKVNVTCMKQFSFSYVGNILFGGGSTTCRKEKTVQCKDGNKEGKVDQVGALPFARDA